MKLVILSGILAIITFLPFQGFYFFGFFFLVPLFIFFITEERFWRLIFGAFIFRLIMISGTVYFTLEPMTWLFSIGIFLGLPISIFILKRVLKQIPSFLILLPFLWTLFDYLEAHYSLLPATIISLGNVFGSSAFLGLATINGLIFLTFFGAVINALIVFLVLKIKARDPVGNIISNGVNFKFLTLYSLLIIIIILGAWQIRNLQLQKNAEVYNKYKNSFRIAVISSNEKFNAQSFNKIENELINKGKIDLIILPEDILGSSEQMGIDFYQNLAKKFNTNLLATFDRIQNQKKYNSSVLFDASGKIIGVYDKNRLTFMGEYWPFNNWTPSYIKWLGGADSSIKNYAVFGSKNSYYRGEEKILAVKSESGEEIKFVSLICLEINYPDDLKQYKKMGARFIINPASNRWINLGISHYLYLTENLKKIEAVWLRTPIISSGVKDFAGIITPDGKADLTNFENKNKNYGLFTGEIRY